MGPILLFQTDLILPHKSCISWALSFYPLPHILILFSLLFLLLIYCLSGHPLSDYIQEFMVQYPIESDYPLHHHLSGIYSLIAKQLVLTRIVIQLVITISTSYVIAIYTHNHILSRCSYNHILAIGFYYISELISDNLLYVGSENED